MRGNLYAGWQERMEEYRLLEDITFIRQTDPFIVSPKHDNGALNEA